MSNRHSPVFKVVVLALALALILGVAPAMAARDRTPPTRPTNLRVTGITPYSVSLAWTPSTDNSGSVIYTICCANVSSETFPGPASSRVYRAGLEAGRTFTLRISARDAAGNFSGYSNSVTFTLPPDVTPPTKPVVSVNDVGSAHVSLAWSSTEDGPYVWFTVFKDGTPIMQGTRDTSANFGLLEPETTYVFTVHSGPGLRGERLADQRSGQRDHRAEQLERHDATHDAGQPDRQRDVIPRRRDVVILGTVHRQRDRPSSGDVYERRARSQLICRQYHSLPPGATAPGHRRDFGTSRLPALTIPVRRAWGKWRH
jgi:hypothetical protein